MLEWTLDCIFLVSFHALDMAFQLREEKNDTAKFLVEAGEGEEVIKKLLFQL